MEERDGEHTGDDSGKVGTAHVGCGEQAEEPSPWGKRKPQKD